MKGKVVGFHVGTNRGILFVCEVKGIYHLPCDGTNPAASEKARPVEGFYELDLNIPRGLYIDAWG
jgi:hypothetical protein